MCKKITVKVTPPWVSVKDRLPDDGSEVLVYYPNCKNGPTIMTDMQIGDGFVCDGRYGDGYFGKATHWMPLPKAPEEK